MIQLQTDFMQMLLKLSAITGVTHTIIGTGTAAMHFHQEVWEPPSCNRRAEPTGPTGPKELLLQ